MKNQTKILIPIFALLVMSCQRKTVTLVVTSNYADAIVFVNELQVGTAPITLNTYPGIIKVVVRHDSCENFNFSDSVSIDTTIKLHAQLVSFEEIKKIEAQKRIAEEFKKQQEQEENIFKNKSSGSFIDLRDKHKYKWIKLGKQVWMAENLSYKTHPESGNCWAYNNSSENAKAYGYLYDWESAAKACPKGWHLPTEQEWKQLSAYLGGDQLASNKLREQGFEHWADGYVYRPIATNECRFTARPGGQRTDKGEFITIGTYAFWWTSTSKNNSEALCHWLGYMGDYLCVEARNKDFGLSVRCVKD